MNGILRFGPIRFTTGLFVLRLPRRHRVTIDWKYWPRSQWEWGFTLNEDGLGIKLHRTLVNVQFGSNP